jgi:2-C-methyl-D-erythritol 4-phosphate cytidylyltransferase
MASVIVDCRTVATPPQPNGPIGATWAIVVAAGSGARFGGSKQFEPLRGRRVIDWSLEAARRGADGVVCVLPEDHGEEPVRAGLAAVPSDAEVIVVHDAARPLAPSDLFAAVVDAVRAGADAAIPGVAVHDTIRHRDEGTVDRAHLVAVQTPQAFRAAALRAAHAGDGEATDDAALVEAAGGTVVVVPGDPHNLKITDRGDLRIAEVLLADEERG